MTVQPTTQPSQHDHRIVALAKDPRTEPQWRRLIDRGLVHGPEREFFPFTRAMIQHGLDSVTFGWVSEALLAYVRSVADEIAENDGEVVCALTVLREDDDAAWRIPGERLVAMTDALVDAGLLTPDEEPSPLEITTLGRAVLLVLEQRRFAERRTP